MQVKRDPLERALVGPARERPLSGSCGAVWVRHTEAGQSVVSDYTTLIAGAPFGGSELSETYEHRTRMEADLPSQGRLARAFVPPPTR